MFSKRLKQARKRAELSQFQLGVLAGIDEFTASARMNQYEKGVHEPDFGLVIRIASALKIPVSYLFEPNDRLAKLILLAGDLSLKDLRQTILAVEKLASEKS
ncbi:XRE family transcriptional regulator [Herbaspirillum lusitanum]|nr:XRE family transcriptional regulator [Herbaspirillum lusitanum]